MVLTGGRIAAAVYRAVARLPARDAVDWSRVDVWWGDERFLPAGDPERNETQARAALLDALPLDPARVHPMPASDGRTAPTRRRPPPGTRPSWPRRPGPARPAAPLRRADARRRRGRARRLGLPGAPGALREPAGQRGTGQPEAAAGADHADPAGDQHRRGGVAGRRRGRQGPRRWAWRWPAPGRCSCPAAGVHGRRADPLAAGPGRGGRGPPRLRSLRSAERAEGPAARVTDLPPSG